MTPADFEESAEYVQSLARGLQVLRAFDDENPSATLSDVAKRVGMSRATVRRLLFTLRHLGYVDCRGRNFFLTPRVLELGHSYVASLNLTDLAQSTVERLSREVGESCSMAVLDGRDIVYVLRVPVRRVMSIGLSIGARLPAFATSMGRVILAGLADSELDAWLRDQAFHAFTPRTLTGKAALRAELVRVRTQGYALVVRELEDVLCSIAVPVRGVGGDVVAALNVGMPYSPDASRRAIKDILPPLRKAQVEIERTVAHRGWPLRGASSERAYG